MHKHRLALAVCCLAVVGLAACGSDQNAAPPPPEPAPAPVTSAPPPPPPAPVKSAIIIMWPNHAAAVQTALNSHGAQLDVDGHMGPKTVAALKTFQKQHKLKVTGKMDHATAKALGV